MIKKILINIYKIFSKIYVLIFGRKLMQKINHIIFSLSLKAKGYNNYGDHKETGESNFIDIIKSELNLCLDIGANKGNYSKLLLRNTETKVIAFEPMQGSFTDLKKIKGIYGNRIDLFNFAIGDENAQKKIYFSNDRSELASFNKDSNKLSFVKNKNKLSQIVNIKKIDDLDILKNVKNIDLIKIDTEGYEMNVIEGGLNLINHIKPKFIQIEFNWHQLLNSQTIYNFSRILKDYKIAQILPHGYPLNEINPIRPESNIFHLSNFVFIHQDISKKYL